MSVLNSEVKTAKVEVIKFGAINLVILLVALFFAFLRSGEVLGLTLVGTTIGTAVCIGLYAWSGVFKIAVSVVGKVAMIGAVFVAATAINFVFHGLVTPYLKTCVGILVFVAAVLTVVLPPACGFAVLHFAGIPLIKTAEKYARLKKRQQS